ncbi:copper chaperone PCu(A)C [Nonomuraea africana]|uniref:Copper(I)-binding protein n=1 Tax=Nonomuraea africana TaxID=46171 RepID=A0ABR9KDF7_9ACTN|nr:copper chaperone PCu(A)C [Nonomuraea africana]MBE1559860.1 copper(I)-binding protein [Nonomuraea africana]
MNRSDRGARAALHALLAACLLLVCLACAEERGPEQWDRGGLVDGQVGPVQLIHAHILAPPMGEQKAGDALGLYVTLVNNSDRDQVLDGVSTVHADSVVYREGREKPQPIEVTVPARRIASLQEGHDRPHLELVGIHRPLGATPIDVTFRFPSAGTITLRIPVLPLSRGAGYSSRG